MQDIHPLSQQIHTEEIALSFYANVDDAILKNVGKCRKTENFQLAKLTKTCLKND